MRKYLLLLFIVVTAGCHASSGAPPETANFEIQGIGELLPNLISFCVIGLVLSGIAGLSAFFLGANVFDAAFKTFIVPPLSFSFWSIFERLMRLPYRVLRIRRDTLHLLGVSKICERARVAILEEIAKRTLVLVFLSACMFCLSIHVTAFVVPAIVCTALAAITVLQFKIKKILLEKYRVPEMHEMPPIVEAMKRA